MKEFDIPQKGLKNTPINFMARSTSDSFQKKLKYTEDAFERKEDHRKLFFDNRAFCDLLFFIRVSHILPP